jgi:hypothetical protein
MALPTILIRLVIRLVIPVETPIDCGGFGLQEIVEAYDKRKKSY